MDIFNFMSNIKTGNNETGDDEKSDDEVPYSRATDRKKSKETKSEYLSKIDYNSIQEEANNISITRSGAFLNFNLIDVKGAELNNIIHKIIKKYTLTYTDITNNFQTIKCYTLDKAKNRIILPRFAAHELVSKKDKIYLSAGVKSHFPDGNKPLKKFVWRGALTDNQKLVCKEIMEKYYNKERVNNGSAGLILDLQAGYGKSFVAAYLIHLIQRKTAIILHSTSILDQWKKVLKQLYDNKIGAYYNKEKSDGDIILFIINSALSKKFTFSDGSYKDIESNDFYKEFGFIIYDECHEYANTFAAEIFKHAQAKYVLGLSATPNENTKGFDPIVHWELGPILVANEIPGFSKTEVNFTADVHRLMYYGPPSHTKMIRNEKTDMLSVSSTESMIMSDPYRIDLILSCIDECLKKNLNTFVFATRRGYLELIRQIYIVKKAGIDIYKNIDNIDIKKEVLENIGKSIQIVDDEKTYMRIVGGAKDEDVKSAELHSQLILTTYKFMGVGRSIPKMNALIMVMPKKTKLKQYYNRVFRLGSDESIRRQIYFINDMRIVLKNQWRTNKLYCESMGYTIKENKFLYQELSKVNLKLFLKTIKEHYTDCAIHYLDIE